MLLILPAFTRRPSLVTGCHSFSCAIVNSLPVALISLLCAPQTCRHGDHVHGRDHGHGHHHGLHEIRIRREREQVRQPFCISVEWTTLIVLSAIVEGSSRRGGRTEFPGELVHGTKKLRSSNCKCRQVRPAKRSAKCGAGAALEHRPSRSLQTSNFT
jgi:hypothetical protein